MRQLVRSSPQPYPGGTAGLSCSLTLTYVPAVGLQAAEPGGQSWPRAGPFPVGGAWASPGLGVPEGDSEEMVSSLTSCARPPAWAAWGRPSAVGGAASAPSACSSLNPSISPSHSNSWRRRPRSRPSPRSPCRRRPSSPSTAAWCRSSTTRTGYVRPRARRLLARCRLPGSPGRGRLLPGPQRDCLPVRWGPSSPACTHAHTHAHTDPGS